MAGDVYGHAPYQGRGGWSWYTGAAAWMHRAAVESIFGLKVGAAELTITPCLPTHWNEAEISLRRGAHRMRFVLVRGSAAQWTARHPEAAAQTLAVGAILKWPELTSRDAESSHCFVIELL